ncbi:MAG TPA: type II secretion system F family protein [Acidimicrobiales bacterium]|nr:type II secretion system F family protein [Acidimicrobiales bacterium]
MTLPVLLAVGLALGGIAAVLAGVSQRRLASDPSAYLAELDNDVFDESDADTFTRRMHLPFLARVMRPLGSGVLDRVTRLTPRNHVLKVHRQLLQSGLSTSIKAEEFVTGQVVATALGLVAAMVTLSFFTLSTGKAVLVMVLLPGIGALLPSSWLARKVQERKDAILNELPDVVDLLAISVEAGVGFEGALEIVCQHFDSPLAQELSRTLKEMELGLPRREALQNLKRRTEVPDLSNFVLALTQADALGMPIGRILHTQAGEMRNKRRARAREKAARLPVKILFPLVVFIFPAVLVVILGPAMQSVAQSL